MLSTNNYKSVIDELRRTYENSDTYNCKENYPFNYYYDFYNLARLKKREKWEERTITWFREVVEKKNADNKLNYFEDIDDMFTVTKTKYSTVYDIKDIEDVFTYKNNVYNKHEYYVSGSGEFGLFKNNYDRIALGDLLMMDFLKKFEIPYSCVTHESRVLRIFTIENLKIILYDQYDNSEETIILSENNTDFNIVIVLNTRSLKKLIGIHETSDYEEIDKDDPFHKLSISHYDILEMLTKQVYFTDFKSVLMIRNYFDIILSYIEIFKDKTDSGLDGYHFPFSSKNTAIEKKTESDSDEETESGSGKRPKLIKYVKKGNFRKDFMEFVKKNKNPSEVYITGSTPAYFLNDTLRTPNDVDIWIYTNSPMRYREKIFDIDKSWELNKTYYVSKRDTNVSQDIFSVKWYTSKKYCFKLQVILIKIPVVEMVKQFDFDVAKAIITVKNGEISFDRTPNSIIESIKLKKAQFYPRRWDLTLDNNNLLTLTERAKTRIIKYSKKGFRIINKSGIFSDEFIDNIISSTKEVDEKKSFEQKGFYVCDDDELFTRTRYENIIKSYIKKKNVCVALFIFYFYTLNIFGRNILNFPH